MFRFASEGYPFILTSAAISLIAALVGLWGLAVASFLLTLFMLFFFRDPERMIIRRKGVFYSPADGRVICVRRTFEDEVLKEEALEVSIFMSPIDVHINRIPCDGIIRDVKYFPGRFYSAFKDISSSANEHITVLLEGDDGRVVMRQVAGFLARRAVCRVKSGDRVVQGQRYGLIKFSSRVDIYLPLDTHIGVKPRDRVRAGETVIGVIQG